MPANAGKAAIGDIFFLYAGLENAIIWAVQRCLRQICCCVSEHTAPIL